MNLSVILIDGAIKIAQKMLYRNRGTKKEQNIVRIYDPRGTTPEHILHESRVMPGLFVDEVNDRVYHQVNGRWVGI